MKIAIVFASDILCIKRIINTANWNNCTQWNKHNIIFFIDKLNSF